MRVLLSTIGSRGDVQPLVALASSLTTLGHDVRFCVPPDFQEWIERLGFAVTPIGPKVREAAPQRAAGAPPAFTPEQRRQLAEATVLTQRDTISAAARGCDVIVAATALQIVARSVAQHLRLPYVFAAYCPIVLPSAHHAPPPLPPLPGEPPAPEDADNRELWSRDNARFNALFRDALNACRASMHLAPVDDVRSHIFGDVPWLAADRTLGPWPDDDARVFQAGAWILHDERPLTPDVDAFLEAGGPPLYLGFGSTRVPQDVAAAAIDAARALGRRVVVSRGWADLSVLDSTPDCLAIDDTNLALLFRRVGAVVHHGGAGTTTLAALAGVPQVVWPRAYDQHYWARRTEELGVGTVHPATAPTAASFAAALTRVLEPNVAARARAVSKAVRRDSAHVAAERLVAMQAAAK